MCRIDTILLIIDELLEDLIYMHLSEKAQLRLKMINIRTSLSTNEVQTKSNRIIDQIIRLPQYSKAETLLVYLPFKNEIDTKPLIEKSWRDNKSILVPVCQPEKKLLLSDLYSFTELEENKYGILEPAKEHQRPTSHEKIDLAIIPGVAFDYSGYRLGYGGGYYDRFLDNLLPDCTKIGLVFDFQLIDKVPTELHDTRVDIILTESRIHYA